jgi:hypothetical protein
MRFNVRYGVNCFQFINVTFKINIIELFYSEILKFTFFNDRDVIVVIIFL